MNRDGEKHDLWQVAIMVQLSKYISHVITRRYEKTAFIHGIVQQGGTRHIATQKRVVRGL